METILLHYTSENGYKWLEKEVTVDDINYKEIINDYVKEHQPMADALSYKWEINDHPDPLYLDFTMELDNMGLVIKINNYIESF